MCLLLVNYKNTISKKSLKTAWNNNTDGAGILYTFKNELKVYKELDSFNIFYQAYLKIRSLTKKPMILHFRISTHGKINMDNCHPFLVNYKLGFAHNGIIDIDTCKNYSDTWYFNEFLKELPEGFIKNAAIRSLISTKIDYSKLAFLDNLGNVTIINEDLGVLDNGNWFSNTTYKDKYTDFGGKKLPSKYDYKEDVSDFEEDIWEKNYNEALRRSESGDYDDFYSDRMPSYSERLKKEDQKWFNVLND